MNKLMNATHISLINSLKLVKGSESRCRLVHGDGSASHKSPDMDEMDTETKGIAILDGNVSIVSGAFIRSSPSAASRLPPHKTTPFVFPRRARGEKGEENPNPRNPPSSLPFSLIMQPST